MTPERSDEILTPVIMLQYKVLNLCRTKCIQYTVLCRKNLQYEGYVLYLCVYTLVEPQYYGS